MLQDEESADDQRHDNSAWVKPKCLKEISMQSIKQLLGYFRPDQSGWPTDPHKICLFTDFLGQCAWSSFDGS